MIGGSLALALGGACEVVGYDTNAQTCKQAGNGFCKIVLPERMGDCSVVFVCVPVAVMQETLDSARAAVGENVILTDVASVKAPFKMSGKYVGGHPMAGAERGGISAARPNLFKGAYWCLTDSGACADEVKSIVELTGAIPVFMTADDHDRAVAAFSHTPHAVAYALVSSALSASVAPIAGSGFLDVTRIAQSDAVFWTEVFKNNRQNVIDGVRSVMGELDRLVAMLESGDYDGVNEYLSVARQKRLALNRAEIKGEALYVELENKLGEFERITGAIARAGINMTNIALIPKSGANGALRLEFETAADKARAAEALGMKSE